MSDFQFYSPSSPDSNGIMVLDKSESHHIRDVLRYKEGDGIWVIDGCGQVFKTHITIVSKKSIEVCVLDVKQGWDKDKSMQLPDLVVGLLKQRQKLELIAEKAVEIGVRRLEFVTTIRSERSEINRNRLQSIMITAMKQCKRTVLPELVLSRSLEESLSNSDKIRPVYVAHEKCADLQPINTIPSESVIYIGPEGGFDEIEINFLQETGNALPIYFGQVRLRTETAAIYALSRISQI